MSIGPAVARRLPALAAACLISVAVPSTALVAKEKIKGGAKPAETVAASYDISIPTIDATGSNVSEDVLRDILSGNLAPHAEALANLDAAGITVPEITITLTGIEDGEPYSADIIISDLELADVADGVADAVTVGSVTMTADNARFSFGELSANNFNISGMLGVYGLVDSGATGMQTIYTDFVSTGGTLDAEDVTCTIGGVAGAEFKARPLHTSFAEIVALAEVANDDPDEVDPAMLGSILRMYADIFTAFETSEVTFDGMVCSGLDEEDRPVSFEIAGMVMGGMAPGIYPSLTVEGFNLEVEGDGFASLDSFTFKPMDLSGPIAVLEAAPEQVDDAWIEANARALVPAMEGLSFAGFDMDVADPEDSDARVKASIGNFDLSLASYRNGIPTEIDMSAQNIRADLPEDSGDKSLEQLRALGITSIDAGFRFAAAWNEASETIEVEEVSMSGVDLAAFVLAGQITNATADLFALDTDTALAAGLGLAVKSLDLSVTDNGLSEIILSMVAAEQGGDPASLRAVFAGLAQGTVIGFMSDVADAAKLGEAVNLFVGGKAQSLRIGIEAKEEPGIGLTDFMEAEDDPAALLGRVNVSAEAK